MRIDSKKIIFMKLFSLTLMLVFKASFLQAQERAAGGSTETQMTWSALKNLVNDANAKSAAAHTRIDTLTHRVGDIEVNVDNLKTCSLKTKLYAPKEAGADANGCVSTSDERVTKIVECGKKGWVFDGSKCVVPAPDKTVYPDRILCKDPTSTGYQIFSNEFVGKSDWKKFKGDAVWYIYAGQYRLAFDRKTGKQVYTEGSISSDCMGKSIQQLISSANTLWPGESTSSKHKALYTLPK